MSSYELVKIITQGRFPEYKKCGWEKMDQHFMIRQSGDVAILKRTEIGSEGRHSDTISFRPPFLIQRGQWKAKAAELTISAACSLEYMGAAEFEFGALPRSLRRIEAQFPLYKFHTVDDIWIDGAEGKQPLRIFANFDTDEQLVQYIEWYKQIVDRKLRLKEWTNLEIDNRLSFQETNELKKKGTPPNEHTEPERTDFWWDLTNDVMFGFKNQYMKRLPKFLQNSFNLMNERLRETAK